MFPVRIKPDPKKGMEEGMKLLTEEIRKRLPKFYETESVSLQDKVLQVKFFASWTNWTWYAVEGQKEGDDFIFFGLVEGFEREWGYFSLKELESVRGPFGLTIERDLDFKPTKASNLQKEEKR